MADGLTSSALVVSPLYNPSAGEHSVAHPLTSFSDPYLQSSISDSQISLVICLLCIVSWSMLLISHFLTDT